MHAKRMENGERTSMRLLRRWMAWHAMGRTAQNDKRLTQSMWPPPLGIATAHTPKQHNQQSAPTPPAHPFI